MAELLTRSIEAARNDVVVAVPPQRVALRTWGALAILCLGAFLVVLDTTIVNIAIPSIMTGLHSSLDQILWVLNAYTLVYAALLIEHLALEQSFVFPAARASADTQMKAMEMRRVGAALSPAA